VYFFRINPTVFSLGKRKKKKASTNKQEYESIDFCYRNRSAMLSCLFIRNFVTCSTDYLDKTSDRPSSTNKHNKMFVRLTHGGILISSRMISRICLPMRIVQSIRFLLFFLFKILTVTNRTRYLVRSISIDEHSSIDSRLGQFCIVRCSTMVPAPPPFIDQGWEFDRFSDGGSKGTIDCHTNNRLLYMSRLGPTSTIETLHTFPS
jgi:hypothetical protein